ncbi:dTDP-4-dehydrorhamnose reductase [Brevundimonas sp.]|uniref:dTDP-4-dehydrorhamnose reductase n=1 Tax=Brevundimonas sp. TaxID=1871086 RepID=UPI001A1F3B7C|nr:dTDP-4-dehydrorhamnose reductase [Brevundimonas sp.]MBJ7483575.1 dTDP-4-dehydrorhamnose reductase [Brevundimonas sp.]
MAGKLLILGGTGQVALDMPGAAKAQGFASSVSVGRETADLTQVDAATLLAEHRPDAIVNAAAYTAVDRAESESEAAFALNADMPGRFAEAAAVAGIPFVQISTDYVFDGRKASAYIETDPREPMGVYGASKAAGEDRVLAAIGRTAVMRTAWVYGVHGANFMKTMVRLAQSRDTLGVVDDQIGSPTRSSDVAEGAARLARALLDGAIRGGEVYHCAGAGRASWADFAVAIFEEEARAGRPAPQINRITTKDFPTPAARPANSQLDCAKLQSEIGWRPWDWRGRLSDLYREEN